MLQKGGCSGPQVCSWEGCRIPLQACPAVREPLLQLHMQRCISHPHVSALYRTHTTLRTLSPQETKSIGIII